MGNPEGFKTPGLFELGLIDIQLDVASLFKKLVVIREIRIEGPEITYERALKNSNIGQLLEQHVHAVENVDRLESGDDTGDVVLLGDEVVRLGADDRRDVTREDERVDLGFGIVSQRTQRDRHRFVREAI